MGLLTSRLSQLRNDPRLLKSPPYLALLCMLGGIIWMLLLPLDEYSRRTYVSENALLPGQVHTYFHGSEQNVFRGYRHEVAGVLEPKSIDDEQGQPTGQYLMATESHRNDIIERIFHNAGLKTARQTYSYESSGKTYSGENVYAIVHGPRADGTESIVLVAPIRNIYDQLNVNGVTLLVTLGRYFSRWSLWSKDIILLVTPDSMAGPQAWVDAYHSMHNSIEVADLSLKSGHIQGAVVVDYPFEHRFESLHVAYDGINGQLPNLDLINTAISIASGQMGIGTTIQSQHTFTRPEDQNNYFTRVRTLIRGMGSQALGHSTGAHSVFMPYHIDAITLTAVGNGWQDEMAFGRSVESLVRSLNNLLEKLHQSFFFYLLLQNTRFVSIGTYLPSAMAVGAGFTIIAIFNWVSSGYEEGSEDETKSDEKDDSDQKATELQDTKTTPKSFAAKKKTIWKEIERPLSLPITILSVLHLSSISTIYLFLRLHAESLLFVSGIRAALLYIAPGVLATGLNKYIANTSNPTFAISNSLPATPNTTLHHSDQSLASTKATRANQLYTIFSSLSLLVLGLELTVLATLNFSLSMILGLVCSPLAFVGYASSDPTTPPTTSSSTNNSSASILFKLRTTLSLLILLILSPPILTFIAAAIDIYYISPFRAPIGIIGRINEYLETEALAFNIWGSWGTILGVWAVWVPAWIVGATGVLASLIGGFEEVDRKGEGQVKVKVVKTNPTATEMGRIEGENEKKKVVQDGNSIKSGGEKRSGSVPRRKR